MKVRELITRLQGEDPEAEVHCAYNYSDHSRTTVTPKVRRVEEVAIRYSEYFSMPVWAGEDDDFDTNKMAVVLFT